MTDNSEVIPGKKSRPVKLKGSGMRPWSVRIWVACARIRRSGSRLRCARTVQKPYLFHRLGLALSEKQMPRFVGNINI